MYIYPLKIKNIVLYCIVSEDRCEMNEVHQHHRMGEGVCLACLALVAHFVNAFPLLNNVKKIACHAG